MQNNKLRAKKLKLNSRNYSSKIQDGGKEVTKEQNQNEQISSNFKIVDPNQSISKIILSGREKSPQIKRQILSEWT